LIFFNKIKVKKRLLIVSHPVFYLKNLFVNLRIGSAFRVTAALAMGLFTLISRYAQLLDYRFRKKIPFHNARLVYQSSNLGNRLEKIAFKATEALLTSVTLENQESRKQLLFSK
jgi:hypothetical protein